MIIRLSIDFTYLNAISVWPIMSCINFMHVGLIILEYCICSIFRTYAIFRILEMQYPWHAYHSTWNWIWNLVESKNLTFDSNTYAKIWKLWSWNSNFVVSWIWVIFMTHMDDLLLVLFYTTKYNIIMIYWKF